MFEQTAQGRFRGEVKGRVKEQDRREGSGGKGKQVTISNPKRHSPGCSNKLHKVSSERKLGEGSRKAPDERKVRGGKDAGSKRRNGKRSLLAELFFVSR